MFARPPSHFAAQPPAPAGPAWTQRLLASPVALAAGAGALCLLAAAALIAVAGDPHAGAPSVRIKLAAAPPLSAGALRSTLTPQAPAPPDPLAEQVAQGAQAVITLPQGARVSGGAVGPQAIDAPAFPASPPLPKAPIAGLTAQGAAGLLPVIAKDGRTPFAAYARPFVSNGKPRVALVIGGLGLNASATKAAIERLPPEVTLSFVPYADGLQAWVDQARAFGHEVVLEIPMEPLDYPNNDPGPYTLMASGPAPETARRLDWLLSRATGYFAVTNYLGGRFLASDGAVNGFVATLKGRGLGFLDDGSARGKGAGAPRASADAVVDQDLSAATIAHQLATLESQAQGHGQSLGAGFAYPVTVEAVSRWAAGLASRGLQLAPASALARR